MAAGRQAAGDGRVVIVGAGLMGVGLALVFDWWSTVSWGSRRAGASTNGTLLQSPR